MTARMRCWKTLRWSDTGTVPGTAEEKEINKSQFDSMLPDYDTCSMYNSLQEEFAMYKELVGKLTEGHTWAKVQEPCSEKEIQQAEKYVGFAFPEELKNLLRETNGDHWFLLSAEEILAQAKRNREILAEYLEPDEFEEKVNRFIYFASNGCGDYYCYRVLPNGKTDTSAIYIWEHELLETREVAKDICDLIMKYYNNEV